MHAHTSTASARPAGRAWRRRGVGLLTGTLATCALSAGAAHAGWAPGSPAAVRSLDGIAAGSDPAGDEYVFWRGPRGHVFEIAYRDGNWEPVMAMAEVGVTSSAPAVAVHSAGNVDLFWRGLDGHLWVEHEIDGSWGPATDLSDGVLGSAPAVGTDAAGDDDVFWRSPHGLLYEVTDETGQWDQPKPLFDGSLTGGPAVAVHPGGEQDVLYRNASGHLDVTHSYPYRDSSAPYWSPPRTLGEGVLGPGLTVGTDAAGAKFAFWPGPSGGIYEATYQHSVWDQPYEVPAGRDGSEPAVTVLPDGQQDLFFRGANGDLWETTHTRSWSQPVDLAEGPLG